MNESVIALRPATAADSSMLLAWRNDFATRNNSRSDRSVNLHEHEAWLSRVLCSQAHVMRIAEIGGEPVGVVRADRAHNGWELSWTVAPGMRGRGISSRMLRAFTTSLDGALTAVIRKDNVASAKAAASAGLMRKDAPAGDDFELWVRE